MFGTQFEEFKSNYMDKVTLCSVLKVVYVLLMLMLYAVSLTGIFITSLATNIARSIVNVHKTIKSDMKYINRNVKRNGL